MTDVRHLPAGSPTPRRLDDTDASRHRSTRAKTWFLAAFVLYAGAVLWTFVFESANPDQALFRGMFVPDTVNITQTFDDLVALNGGIPYEPTLSGVSLLYGWLWTLDPAISIWLNLAMMLVSGLVALRIMQSVDASGWAVLGVYCNPYLVLAAVAPNKEVPLILISLTWAALILRHPFGWQILTLLLAFAAYLFRDGYGASLAVVSIFAMAMGLRGRLLTVVFFSFCLAISALFGVLLRIVPILERNYSGFQESFDTGAAVGNFAAYVSLDPLTFIGGIVLFPLRMIYNLLTMAIFPVLRTEFLYPYWLGYAYWIFGIGVLIAILGCIARLANSDQSGANGRRAMLAAIVAVTWSSISISQFVQPRYLMPILPIGVCVLATLASGLRKKLIAGALAVVTVIIGLYVLRGQTPLPAPIMQQETPSFLWAAT